MKRMISAAASLLALVSMLSAATAQELFLLDPDRTAQDYGR